MARVLSITVMVVFIFVWGCGDDISDGNDGGDENSGDSTDGDTTGDDDTTLLEIDTDIFPEAICESPDFADVSSPTSVVGEGSPESCTNEALQTAATKGGVIVFDCGTSDVSIDISTTVVVTTGAVINGGGQWPSTGRTQHVYCTWIPDMTRPNRG